MVKLCQEYDREHPTEMWLIYDAQKNSLDSRYSYEGRYDKDEELLPRLEFEKWFEEVKVQGLQELQMIQFEDKFMEVQSSMVSLALEYVHGQADKIFIYAIADSLYSYNVFYQINYYIVRKHEVNKYLPEELSVDTNLQSVLLKEGIKDIEAMIEICKEYNREHPTEMWLIYDAQKNSLDSRYSYEGRYDKDEELLPRLEFEKWFEEVKAQEL